VFYTQTLELAFKLYYCSKLLPYGGWPLKLLKHPSLHEAILFLELVKLQYLYALSLPRVRAPRLGRSVDSS